MFFDPKPFDLYNTNIRQRHGRNEPLIIDLVMEMTFKFSLGKVDRISFPSYLITIWRYLGNVAGSS